ncbi:hypothetical protein PWT90_06075 [Aphanocladium album]|nr:hypothetical protein PWT90_06075 [Aphanocladium album]
MATPEEAREVVGKLTRKYGYLREEMMEKLGEWNSEFLEEIEEYRTTMERSVSHSIKTLARNIYDSNARFIFELLQNADDNKFTKAAKKNLAPGITFKLWPDKIVIDCNEDGFTEKDLEAICSIGESSKTTSHGYIGAKGIGFKSVFMVASRVHIQSGHFSFEFFHRREDPGIGMVRPIWKTPVQMLDGPMTRMTLWLHSDGDAAETAHQREVIDRQFKDLEIACLLFLKNLRVITVERYLSSNVLAESRKFNKSDPIGHRVALETTTRKLFGSEISSRRTYHVTRLQAINLPHSSNRSLTPSDENLTMAGAAEVVLAFPLTEETPTQESQPITNEVQHLFAFLPLKQDSRFKFLIHSDFDTNGSRQDILVDSQRNITLLDWIAKTFVLAAVQFSAQHDTLLSYEWPLFLPMSSNWGDFWTTLERKIHQGIRDASLFRSRKYNTLRKLQELYEIPANARLTNGEPVLEDTTQDIYLSRHYSLKVKLRLREPQYGLVPLNHSQFLELVRKDLASNHSIMRKAGVSCEWHSVVAKAVINAGKTNDIHDLELLPLRNGEWVTGRRMPVYLPTVGEIPIPLPLGLRVLEPSAVANDARKELFLRLGATEASVNTVRTSILNGFLKLSFGNPLDHLRFLYQTSPPEMKLHVHEPSGLFHCIYLDPVQFLRPSVTDVYLPQDSGLYGPLALLSDCDTIAIDYASPEILRDPPPRPSEYHPTWEQWLHGCIGIRSRLRLFNARMTGLSAAALYVLSEKPFSFLGLLEHLWKNQPHTLKMDASLRKLIDEVDVTSICNFAYPILLQESYFPLKSLREVVEQYMETSAAFPFLQIETEMDSFPSMPGKWRFLYTDFHVRGDNNLRFLLDILWWICPDNFDDFDKSDDFDDDAESDDIDSYDEADESEVDNDSQAFINLSFSQDFEGSEYSQKSDGSGRIVGLSTTQLQKLCDLYEAIYAKLVLSTDVTHDRITLMETFDEEVVYIPDDDAPFWATRSECRWHGPPMTTTNVLYNLYGRMLGDKQMTSLELLFSKTLLIPDVSSEDIIEELTLIRDDWHMDPDEPSLNSIKELYRYLLDSEKCVSSDYSDGFRSEGLIYARSGDTWGWYKSSDCLWSSKTNIEGKAVLNTHYEELEDFFVGCLGVKSLTLEMVYDELSRTSSRDVADIKSKIMVFASLLAIEPIDLNPAPILEASIFPLKYPANPAVEFANGNVDFAIADRDYLRQRFQSKAKILDLTLEEVRRASPFFEWLNFQDRYLSRRVKEITSVGSISGTVASSATHAMQRKAKYLIRIAATFESPRYENDNVGLLQQLRSVSVIETHALSTTFSIIQDNRLISVESESGSVHVAETANSMTIYVPKDKKSRAICFVSVLPAAYGDWLMLNPTNNRQGVVTEDLKVTLMSVFASPVSALDIILDRCGIFQASSFSDVDDSPEAENEDTSEDDCKDDDGNDSASHTLTPATGTETGQWDTALGFSRTASQVDSLSERSETVGRDVYENRTQSSPGTLLSVEYANSNNSRQRNLSSPAAPGQQPLPSNPSLASNSRSSMSPYRGNGLDSHGQYEILLDHVVAAAQSSIFPPVTVFSMEALATALPGTSDSAEVESYDGVGVSIRSGSMSQLERDKRVGAAGELYVYELLKKEGLPDWGPDNWQSRIRTYARAHPAHALLEPWTRSETSDLVYDDSEGYFTRKLMHWGYLAPEEWQGARPKYYFEVKTTTGPCRTPFYASGKQYRLVSRMQQEQAHAKYYLFANHWMLDGKHARVRK